MNRGRNRRCNEALIESAHDIVAAAEPDEESSEHRPDDANTADQQRQKQHCFLYGAGKEDRTDQHRRNDGHRIGLEKVGRHAGTVADIVANVIGDHGRIPGVVFRDAGFDLADHVSADIRTLGEDTAAKAGKDRNQRCTEAERDKRFKNMAQARRFGRVINATKHNVIARDPEQSEADHQHTGDGARLECDSQRRLQSAGPGGICRSHVRANRDVHADVTGRTGEHRTNYETDCRKHAEKRPDHEADDDADHPNGHILTVQVGRGAFLNRARDFLHFLVACRSAQNRATGIKAVQDRKTATRDHDPISCRHFITSLFLFCLGRCPLDKD